MKLPVKKEIFCHKNQFSVKVLWFSSFIYFSCSGADDISLTSAEGSTIYIYVYNHRIIES